MIYIYRIIYFILKHILLLTQPMHSPSLKKWLQLRKTQTHFNPHKPVIWFHASSGEVEYVKSLIRWFKSHHPEYQMALSYSSPSMEKLIHNIQSELDWIFPLPWDSPTEIKSIFDHLKPAAVIFSRTDFWYELVWQAEQKNVPLFGVSLFPSRNFIQKIWFQKILSSFQLLTAVTQESAEYLRTLVDCPVYYLPDTRFDQVFYRLNQTPLFKIRLSRRCLTVGSCWPEDEAVLIPALTYFKSLNIQFILCPHDIQTTRIENIQKQIQALQSSNLSVQIYSDIQHQSECTSDILIVDKVGILADIYQQSTWAFVGGSFKKRVHSVMEPLCAGNLVFVGPYHQNNPEALQYLNQQVFQVHSTEDFIKKFNAYKDRNQDDRQKTIQLLSQNKGSTEKTGTLIQSVIKDSK